MKLLATILVALTLCGCGQGSTLPDASIDAGCLTCAQAKTRHDEKVMCPGVEQTYWEPVLGCRCAPQGLCESACVSWCKFENIDGGDSCSACTAAKCAAQLAACQAH